MSSTAPRKRQRQSQATEKTSDWDKPMSELETSSAGELATRTTAFNSLVMIVGFTLHYLLVQHGDKSRCEAGSAACSAFKAAKPVVVAWAVERACLGAADAVLNNQMLKGAIVVPLVGHSRTTARPDDATTQLAHGFASGCGGEVHLALRRMTSATKTSDIQANTGGLKLKKLRDHQAKAKWHFDEKHLPPRGGTVVLVDDFARCDARRMPDA